MAEIMGVPKGEISKAIGMKITEMPNVISAGIVDKIKEMSRGKVVTNLTVLFASLYQKQTFLSANMLPLLDEKGQVKSGLLVVRNITEEKKAEEELKKRAEELEKTNKFMVGRELDMIEIKKEVNQLLKELGKPEKYRV